MAGSFEVVDEVFFEGPDCCGDAGYEGVGRDSGAFLDDGTGGDEAELADFGVGEEGGVDADEGVVADLAGFDNCAVADGDVLFDVDAAGVDDGVVLDVGAVADAGSSVVGADDGTGEDDAVLADFDVADEDGEFVYVGGGVDAGGLAFEGADGHVVGLQKRVESGYCVQFITGVLNCNRFRNSTM